MVVTVYEVCQFREEQLEVETFFILGIIKIGNRMKRIIYFGGKNEKEIL